jgi:outer membrane protein assembly factor BamB
MKKSKETRTNRNRKNTCFFAITGIVAVALICTILAISTTAQLADTPWPMYHHDMNHTGLSPYTGPDTNAIKWSYTTGGYIRPSPAIGADDTIYVGSRDDKLYAIYPNGTLKWSYLTGDDIYSSPAIDADGTVYVGSCDKKYYAIYPNGTLRWSYLTGDRIYSSPAIGSDGTIYAGSKDKKLYAIYPNGTLKWSYLTGGYIYYSSPAIGSDGTIYIGVYDFNLYAINPDGTHKWSYLTGDKVCSSPTIGSDGTVYVGSKDDKLYAINPNGTLKWSYLTGDNVCSTPAIDADGTIYVGSDDYNLHAIYPNGTLKWSYLTGDKINYCSPAIDAAGTIYVGSRDDKLHAIYPNGTHKWSYLTGGNIDYTSPAIGSDGTIYIGSYSDHKLYAFGPGAAAEPDLLVTDVNAYHNNTGCPAWFNLSNEIDVTVKNNGSANAGASSVSLYIEDVFFGKLSVSGLSAGASETVTFENWKPVGEDCLQPVCDFSWSYHDYNLTGVADCDGDVAESNETNNETTVVERVCYNGYIADEPLENVAHGKLHGHLLFTTGNGVYTGLYSVGDTQTTEYEINVPAGASVKLANLNVYYTWCKPQGTCPEMEVSIQNGTGTYILPLEKAYNDVKCTCPGASWVLTFGNYVYDLTDYIDGSGTYTVTVKNVCTVCQYFCPAAPGIVLVYEDANAPMIEYWINKGADVLIGGRRADGGYLAWWECINNATFTASTQTEEVVSATLGVVAPWGDDVPDDILFFNDVELGRGVYHGYFTLYNKTIDSLSMYVGESGNAQVGANVSDVTGLYLNDSDNVVGQADDGDNIMAANAFLVVEYEEEGICGDVNKDGDVNVLDATKVKNRAGNPSYPLDDEWAADVNCDMSIDVRDATKVMNRAGNPGYPLGCCT